MRQLRVLCFYVFSISTLTSVFSQSTEDDWIIELSAKKSAVIETLQKGDYKTGRSLLAEILPLMKKDLKELERKIQQGKKSDLPKSKIQKYKESHKFNLSVYESLRRVMEVSPAALRVQARKVINQLEQYSIESLEAGLLAAGN